MSTNRVAEVESRFDRCLQDATPSATRLGPGDALQPGRRLTVRAAMELFEDQLLSRQLDVAARELKRTGRSFYTIGSAGHENNAVLGALLALHDPCLLHYRSGALMAARARKLAGSTPCFDTLLSLCAAQDDPISGGRHKVWGSRALWVPPQTSTIASHLPKATGLAFALARARRLGIETGLDHDSIVLCSFGDASANHATALTGINAARYMHRRVGAVPILFVCEDNGIGISTETPAGWIREQFQAQSHLAFFEAVGDLAQIYESCALAIEHCRALRMPVFLRLETVRLWGHAGSDVESTYHSLEEIEGVEARDPLQANAALLIERGAATPAELQALVAHTRERVAAVAEQAAQRPKLVTRAQVLAPLAPYSAADCAIVQPALSAAVRAQHFGAVLPEQATSPTKRTLAALVNAALHDEFLRRKELVLFGEDVAKKGGVYGLTAGLQKRFGPARVFDSLLDETSILGLAQGMAQVGFFPCPEIQYLAYVHNAIDQLRGEACSLSFFSNGAFKNPMVVRIAGLAYQKGFGGHFHNDNSFGALREIPGLLIAAPARGDDAVRLLRGLWNVCWRMGRVGVFLEPIALYHERDLYAEGDNLWLCDYPAPGGPSELLLPGAVHSYGTPQADLLLVSYANGLRLCLRAARELEREGKSVRVLDLCWLNPLPLEALLAAAAQCARVLVVDECRATGAGVADALIAALAEEGYRGRLGSVRAADSYVPLGTATAAVLVDEAQILQAAHRLFA